MHRFFADPGLSDDKLLFLSPEDAYHARAVLRMKPGQQVELIHQSALWIAELLSVEEHEVCARPVHSLPSAETSLAITLFQGLPKSDKMDWIVQKATEIGVSRIVPLVMSRCVVKYDTKKDRQKIDRWQKIIREACKQSGRCVVPTLAEPCSIKQLRDLSLLPELNVVPWEGAESYGPRSFYQDHSVPSSLGILIGPEGGIDSEEISVLQKMGFVPITLGKRILRTETAGLAAVSAFLGLYGEMDS